MTDLTLIQADVRPAVKAIVRPYKLGGSADVGDAVFVAADGDVEVANADTAEDARAIGVVVSVGAYGALAGIVGDMVDVCVFGAIFGFAGITPGDLIYTSVNDGKLADAVPAATNFKWAIGRGEVDNLGTGAYMIFINPFTDDLVVLS